VLNADTIYSEAFSNGLRPDPQIDFVEWANTKMRLQRESSVEPGHYRTSRTPYVEEILHELSPQSSTTEAVAIKPTQFGFTVLGNILLFGTADLYPAPCMFAMPTEAMAQKHSKKKVAPALKEIPCLRDKVRPAKAKDSGNTILLKEFPGGSWTFTGTNSPVSARSDSIKILILDDLDGFVMEMGDEGDYTLLENRTDAFGKRKKIYKNSTPTIAGVSHIEREFKDSSQGHYQLACPRCGKYQYLVFGGKDTAYGLKFKHNSANEVTEIWYVCEHCGGRIEEHEKTEMFKTGKYVHKFPERRKRGFKINSLYSPPGWVSWAQVAEEFLKAGNNKQKLKRWTNTRMAEAFDEAGSRPDWVKLKARCEPYKIMTVPAGGKLITCGFDTQDNRLPVVIRAWGKGEENWLIWQGELMGDPAQQAVWDQLDGLLNRTYQHESGAQLRILSMGGDTQGHRTQAVYNYCRQRDPIVFALQGASKAGRPVIGRPTLQDVTWQGETIKDGVQLWPIGTDTAKSVIYSRFNLIANPEFDSNPGVYHWPMGTDDEYFQQITAEKLVTGFDRNGYAKQEWKNVRSGGRNDFFDAEVYCYAAAVRAGLERIDFDKIILNPEKVVEKHRPKPKQEKGSRW